MPRIDQIQLRRDSAADWTSANPVLAAGEPGIEEDTGLLKLGDGATAWNSLNPLGKTLGAVFDKTQQKGNLGATPTFDFATYPIITGTINATITAMTLTWPTMGTDQTYTVLLYLVLGGAFTVAWDSSIKWLDDTAPTLTNGKFHRFYLTRIYNGAWRVEGTFAGKST